MEANQQQQWKEMKTVGFTGNYNDVQKLCGLPGDVYTYTDASGDTYCGQSSM